MANGNKPWLGQKRGLWSQAGAWTLAGSRGVLCDTGLAAFPL